MKWMVAIRFSLWLNSRQFLLLGRSHWYEPFFSAVNAPFADGAVGHGTNNISFFNKWEYFPKYIYLARFWGDNALMSRKISTARRRKRVATKPSAGIALYFLYIKTMRYKA